MENNKKANVICKSIFKGGLNTTSKTQFTKALIELLNKIEKDKSKVIKP